MRFFYPVSRSTDDPSVENNLSKKKLTVPTYQHRWANNSVGANEFCDIVCAIVPGPAVRHWVRCVWHYWTGFPFFLVWCIKPCVNTKKTIQPWWKITDWQRFLSRTGDASFRLMGCGSRSIGQDEVWRGWWLCLAKWKMNGEGSPAIACNTTAIGRDRDSPVVVCVVCMHLMLVLTTRQSMTPGTWHTGPFAPHDIPEDRREREKKNGKAKNRRVSQIRQINQI